MKSQASLVRIAKIPAVVLTICVWSVSAVASEASVARTNWVERWITNVIDVRMPLNRFVDEYHTNWVTQFRTNVFNVYATNRLTRALTNRFSVDAFRTNFVTAYQTNWRTLDLTNWQTAVVMKTNLLNVTLTNLVQMDVLRTNFVTLYHTNWKTLDLTNWQTALVMKTNWVTQMLTNVVQTDVSSTPGDAPGALPSTSTSPTEASASTPAPVPSATGTCPAILEVIRAARPSNSGQVAVCLRVNGNGARSLPMHVQQWRVEREDRAILCFGQDQEFKRDLPAGKYKVEVKIPQEGEGSLLTARATLAVSLREVVIERNLAAAN